MRRNAARILCKWVIFFKKIMALTFLVISWVHYVKIESRGVKGQQEEWLFFPSLLLLELSAPHTACICWTLPACSGFPLSYWPFLSLAAGGMALVIGQSFAVTFLLPILSGAKRTVVGFLSSCCCYREWSKSVFIKLSDLVGEMFIF